MTPAQSGLPGLSGLSKHRLEALTDGIFAVAMTLLVIELNSVNMMLLGMMALLKSRYVFHHPERCATPQAAIQSV